LENELRSKHEMEINNYNLSQLKVSATAEAADDEDGTTGGTVIQNNLMEIVI
jgi:hypothetical protein